jgi:peptidyl-prolyl cis-trans isomerase C
MMRVLQPSRSLPLAVLALVATGGLACAKEKPAAEASAPAPAEAAAPAAVPAASPATTPVGAPPGAAAAGDAAARPQVVDPATIPDVVARIDGVDVTKSDLLARATEARGALAQRGTRQPPPTREFYRKVLDDIIGNRLLFRDLTAKNQAANATEIAAQMQAIRGQFPSDEAFDQALAERGFDRARLERDVAESVTVQKWVAGVVVPSVTVTEADVRKYFDENPERMVEPERVHARHILIRAGDDVPAEEKAARRKKAEELRARIAAGGDFAAIAREASDDKGSGERGGDLGWFYRGQMVPAFEKAAFELPPNTLSPVVETRFGFHLIEVIEKRAESKLAFEQVKDRLEAMLKQRQLEEKVRGKINELGAKAKIEILI